MTDRAPNGTEDLPSLDGFTDLVPIGRGGFSTVYSATQVGIDRRVAVKVLDLGISDHERFLRECRTLGSLSDVDGIVGVLQACFAASGRPCIVMALMSGGSLAARVRTQGPLPASEVVSVGIRLAAALQRAHDQRIFHRDIKPENVLFSGHGDAAIADFGIALVEGTEARSQTIESISPPHAPPERFSGAQADPALGDVYSLGSTLFTALTGSPPFGTAADGGMAGLISRVLSSPVPRPTTTKLDPALYDVLARSMAKDPSQRQPSMDVLRRELEAVAAALRSTANTGGLDDVEDRTVLRTPSVGPTPPHPPTVVRRPAVFAGPPPPGPPSTAALVHGGAATTGKLHPVSTPAPTHTRSDRTRAVLWGGAAALFVCVIAAAAVLLGVQLSSDEAAPTSSTAPTPETTTTVSTTTTVPTTTTDLPEPTPVVPPTAEPAQSSSGAPPRRPTTTTTSTTAAPPLPVSEATTAVDLYLEAGSSYDTEFFVDRWQFPIEKYYRDENRDVPESALRQQAAAYWEKYADLHFTRNGPTSVTATDAGWDTSTEYTARLWKPGDVVGECQIQTIHLGFTHDWLVRTAAETGSRRC